MKSTFTSHLLLLPIAFFLCIPALFVKQNIDDIHRIEPVILVILFGLTAISIAVFLTLNALFRKKHLNFLLGNAAEFVCFFIIATGFLVPVSLSAGMIDPEYLPIDFPNLLIALVLASLLSWISNGAHRQSVHTGLILFVALNTALSVYLIFPKIGALEDSQSLAAKKLLYEVSGKKNIFVLSFDGISGSAAMEVLSENKSLSARFDGFTLFSNAVASSPATSASTAASLYGNQNFKAMYETEAELWDASPDDLLTNYLNSHGYQVSTFGIYNSHFTANDRKNYAANWSGIDVAEIINFTIARTLTSTYVLPKATLFWLESKARNIFFGGNAEKNSLLPKIGMSYAPKWDSGLATTILDTENYIRGLNLGDAEPRAHFIHFTFTHYPVEFNKNCQFMGHIAQWFESNQNRQGVKEETYCALTLFAEFVEKLKTLGIFNQSMIALKSDHGKPVSYYDQGGIESARINNHDFWGYGRYEPFLAIKKFGQHGFSMRDNRSPVLLDDLARTICTAVFSAEPCKIYPGFDLLDESLSISNSATATVFVVRSENSDYKYDSHKAVTVKRQPNILQNLHKQLSHENIQPEQD